MGDNITDLLAEPGQPPVPPKTYQWEDIRRQKLEGRYPWTHLYKPPFNLETYEKTKDHEYEPVIPMDTNRKTPPPFLKVTTENESKPSTDEELVQDRHHLCIPKNEEVEEDDDDYEDDDDDDTEEITAAELQNRLEEKYFRQSPGSSKHEYELTETRSVSPVNDDTSGSSSFQEKVNLQADKIKQKFKNLKDQISSVENSPRVKRKDEKSKPVKKNKFNFRKHAPKLPDRANFHMPQAPRLSFSSLSSFSRSRSNSVKERERKRSQSSESDSQKKKFDFHFGTYPRIFSKKKKTEKVEKENTPKLIHKSAPSSPLLRRSPFPQRWISKLTDKKEDDKKEEKVEKKPDSKKHTVVQESIFISLHEDETSPQLPTSTQQFENASEEPMETRDKPSSMKIDNKNFIFISLHEERFPEKLEKLQQEQDDDSEVESDVRKNETAKKFTNLLRRLETDRKLKAKRFADRNVVDDKPEPVTITEITTDDEGDTNNSALNLENSVETPEETSEEIRPPSTEPSSYVEEKNEEPVKPSSQSDKASPILDPKKFESMFTKTLEPIIARTKPDRIFNKTKTPELARAKTPESVKAKTPEPVKAKTPEPTKAKTPEPIKAKTSEPIKAKTPEPIRAKTTEPIKAKTPEPVRAKTPEPANTITAESYIKITKIKTSERATRESRPASPPFSEPKEPSKFLKIKEIIKDTEKFLKPSSGEKNSSEKEVTTLPNEPKEKETKKFAEFKENLLKETEKIGTLKNKIKNYFVEKTDTLRSTKSDKDDKHIYEEFDNIDDPPRDTTKRVATSEKSDEPAPQKAPRKKLKKLDSDKESKESLSAFDDPTLNDIITLDEQTPMTKTYINASLQEVHDVPIQHEPEQSTKHFRNYEKALEKSRSYSSIEIENNQYSTNNTLARLEAPVPPSRPSRTRSLQRNKRAKLTVAENKENDYEQEQSQNYNTFPMIKPDKPKRKFRKHRTYSNSTNKSDVKSVNEMEDAAISQNIANSKQLSVSFLPLTSNIVGEPITSYNLRETSSMIHLNLNSDPPLPPKRRKSSAKDVGKYNTLPNRKYSSKTSSKTSLAASETCNGIHADTEDFEYADDVNSTAASDTPPRRPGRKRSAGPSLIDEDRTSREIESLPSEKSLCDSDSKDINGYAVIKPAQKSHSQPTAANTTPRRKSRRLSDFFTLPRIRPPTNYVTPASTLDYERRPSPSRPPRRSRQFSEPLYTNEETINLTTDLDFGDEEELNFNLATEDDIPEPVEKDDKHLQTDEVMERMKVRPLPPPPRPTRKPRDSNDPSCDYSQVKKNFENATNNLNHDTNELKIINTDEAEPKHPEVQTEQNIISKNTESKNLTIDKPSSSSTLNVITAQQLNVSELNVAKLSISEINSSRLVTSDVDSVTMHVSDIKSDAGNLVINSVQLTSNCPLTERLSPVPPEPRVLSDSVESASVRDVTPSSEEANVQETLARSRISSMIPEVGSDEESTSTVTKVVRPSRRKSVKKEEPSRSAVSETNQPTLAELMCQILQICHSSVGQAIHALLEQIIPEDREKRNEVQAAIWVITIIVAGCLMLGLQTNEKIVHHHHWDFHFPPPH